MKNNTTQRYPIQDSPFFRMSGISSLEKLLFLSPGILSPKKIDEHLEYNVFEKISGKKIRRIESPIGNTKRTHKRLLNLLQRIETPQYLYSGIKGKSYINNALAHKNNQYVVAMDIKSFYPSCRQRHIFKMLRSVFQTSEAVAGALTRLVTIEGHLPTGSPISQILAYLTYRDTFDEIYRLSVASDILFTLYVDDMTFSSTSAIPTEFISEVSKMLLARGLKMKDEKTKKYNPGDFKKITGVAISPSNTPKITNKQRQNIVRQFKMIKSGNVDDLEQSIKSLRGRLIAARQVERNAFPQILEYINTIHRQHGK